MLPAELLTWSRNLQSFTNGSTFVTSKTYFESSLASCQISKSSNCVIFIKNRSQKLKYMDLFRWTPNAARRTLNAERCSGFQGFTTWNSGTWNSGTYYVSGLPAGGRVSGYQLRALSLELWAFGYWLYSTVYWLLFTVYLIVSCLTSCRVVMFQVYLPEAGFQTSAWAQSNAWRVIKNFHRNICKLLFCAYLRGIESA